MSLYTRAGRIAPIRPFEKSDIDRLTQEEMKSCTTILAILKTRQVDSVMYVPNHIFQFMEVPVEELEYFEEANSYMLKDQAKSRGYSALATFEGFGTATMQKIGADSFDERHKRLPVGHFLIFYY